MSRDQTKGELFRNCFTTCWGISNSNSSKFGPFYCLLGNVFFGIFPRLAAQSKQMAENACLRRCGLLCDLYSHSTWYLCSSCVYPCTICDWVLFFNCFLRQNLLFAWQIVEVLAATPTHGRTPTKERRQPATVLVCCHAHPRTAFATAPPLPLSPSPVCAVCRKFCCIKVFVMLRCRFLALYSWVHKICHVCYFCDELDSSSNWSRSWSWRQSRRGGEKGSWAEFG